MRHTKSYHEGHPNPQAYRPCWQLLNGEWDFLFDDENIGEKEKYYKNFPKDNNLKIIVPYAYESPKSGIEDKSEHNILWYKKVFVHKKSKDKVILHFEKSDYITKVWLNGHFVGSHTGGYDAFSFEVTDEIKDGENTLIVRVFDSKNARQLRGKQTWKATPFECFYDGTSGIYGDVWLEEVNTKHLESFIIETSGKDRKLFINAIVSEEAINKYFEIKVEFAGKTLQKERFIINNIEDAYELELTSPLKLWSSETPNLYDLTLSIIDEDKVTDEVLSYFGINDVGIKGKFITLNGEETYLKFVLDQGYFWGGDLTGTFDDFMLDINYLKKAGFNGVRKHEKIESKLFFYLADINGLLNWIELPSPHEFNIDESEIIKHQFTRIIKEHMSHPSVMTYICYNESWGVHKILENKVEQDFTVELYKLAKSIDKRRLVISNDGWEHTISDLLTVHNYQETYEQLFATYKDMLENLKTTGNAMANETRKAYANNYIYRGEPILMTEFAGIAIDNNTSDGWGYGKAAKGVEGFLNKLEHQVALIKHFDFFTGYCITQLSDVYQEKNGLLTHDRKIKITAEDIKKIIK